VRLGKGKEVYESACKLLNGWRMHENSRHTGIEVQMARVGAALATVVRSTIKPWSLTLAQRHRGC